MIVIYTPRVTNRLKYIFEHIFQEYYSSRVVFNQEENSSEKNLVIAYGENVSNADLFFPSSGLLFEDDVREQKLEVDFDHDYPIIFKTNSPNQSIAFDVFSAAFYFLTRYEEYLPFVSDKHGRFPAKESLAYKNSFIDKAVVDYYISKIVELIAFKKPNFTLTKRTDYTVLPTFDIDIPFAYKGRILNGFPHLIKDLLFLNFRRVKERIKVLNKLQQDPFDIYDEIIKRVREKNRSSIFFFLMSNKGQKNNPVSINNQDFQSLISKIKSTEKIYIGLHPSYKATETEIELEKIELEKITRDIIIKSRYHFLKLNIPNGYRNLINKGIKEDYSMAFPEICGFRASTCNSFYWFDLLNNETTKLKIFPFVVMDATWKYYDIIEEKAIFNDIDSLKREVKKYKGLFILNFHNDIIATKTTEDKVSWKEVFNYAIK